MTGVGKATCSTAPRGKFLQFTGCFPWLIWLQQKVPRREQGNQTSASRGFGYALCLGGFIWFDLLIFIWGLFWFFERRLEMGLEAIWGEAQKAALGMHAVPMEIRGSSLRLVCSFGCHWRLPWQQSTTHFWDCLCSGSWIISDYQNFLATR